MQDVHIGPFPPPIGGISVYLYRLSKIDRKSLFIDEKDITGSKKFRLWLIKQLFSFKKKNFIYHSHFLKNRLIFYFLSVLSIHEFSLVIHGRSLIIQYNNSNFLIKFLIKRMLKKAKFIQVINPQYKDFIYKLGVKNKHIIVKNAFLPPILEEEQKIIASYEKKLLELLEVKKPIIIASAFAIQFYNNVDLYGLDLCVELTKLLKKDFPNIGLLFIIANEKTNAIYLKKMKERIKDLNLNTSFFIITGQREIWPLFRRADLMIRPTCVDGYGVSIAEAIYLNRPAIASDVCKRPEGTILFKNRNLEDLYEKCKQVLNKNY